MIFSNHVSKYIGLCIFQDREILFFLVCTIGKVLNRFCTSWKSNSRQKKNGTIVAKGSKCLKVLSSASLIRQLSATKRIGIEKKKAVKIAQQCNSLDVGKKVLQQHKEKRNWKKIKIIFWHSNNVES